MKEFYRQSGEDKRHFYKEYRSKGIFKAGFGACFYKFGGIYLIYGNVKKGIFLRRPNRFVAYVDIDGAEEKVHVKNTGRCRELLVPGAQVVLEEGLGEKRKTKYSITAVYKNGIIINMDSQAPNAAAAEAVLDGRITEIGSVDILKREVKYLNSRFDIYYEAGSRKGFAEVKGVTLEKDGDVYFPDAPTDRGRKHLLELVKAAEEGYEASVIFIVQLKCGGVFRPNAETDPKFAEALRFAAQKGVNIIAYDCFVEENEMTVNKRVKVELE